MVMTQIETVDAFRAQVDERGGLDGCVVQGLDLSAETARLETVSARGAAFLGCQMSPIALSAVSEHGALIFPRLDELPYHPYRPALYTPAELMRGHRRGDPESFARDTLDGRIYAHYDRHRRREGPPEILEALAQRLHDHAIDDALSGLLHGPDGGLDKDVVAIMGGHAVKRGERAYRDAAALGRALTARGFFMTSGGGPGVMEATHVGAWLASASEDELGAAIDTLEPAPSYKDPAWFDTAYEVLDRHPEGAESLGIPTWFYGHEPSNLFATHVAKYFSNSLREDGLLAIATHGVIYAPGSAGTIQEIFMDAAQNHYGTFKVVSPMVFLGTRYWTETHPVFEAVRNLAGDRQYASMLHLCDDVDEAVEFISTHPPVDYQG